MINEFDKFKVFYDSYHCNSWNFNSVENFTNFTLTALLVQLISPRALIYHWNHLNTTTYTPVTQQEHLTFSTSRLVEMINYDLDVHDDECQQKVHGAPLMPQRLYNKYELHMFPKLPHRKV